MLDSQPDLRRHRDPKTRAAKLDRITEVAMRHFAEHGYGGARVEDIANELGIAKASIFRHFGSKQGLFVETYKVAVQSLAPWDAVPKEVWDEGFFATIAYWLHRTEEWVQEVWIPFRVAQIGSYVTDLPLKRELYRFLWSEDPGRTLEFVEYGISRGEVRSDVAPELVCSVLGSLVDQFQEAIVSDELDPGLFRLLRRDPSGLGAWIDQFLRVLRGAIGAML
jgi:AcrR family transcriptional regulator